MGSSDNTMADLPAADHSSVVVMHPSEDEMRHTWALTAAEWAGPLTQAQYLEREPYLNTIPLNRNGGITHWILTTDGGTAATDKDTGRRPILSSCESYKKKVLVAAAGGKGEVTEEIGHGVGSVYTDPKFRGRSYASRLLAEVGTKLAEWDVGPLYQKPDTDDSDDGETETTKKRAICSALWSDIGKKFYAKKGWIPYASQHVEFAALPAPDKTENSNSIEKELPSTQITYRNVGSFCAIDEAAMRKKLVKTAAETGKTTMAFSPSHDQMLWHLYRDSYIASIVFPDRDPNLVDVPVESNVDSTTSSGRAGPAASSSTSSSPSRQPRSGAALRRHPGALEVNEVKGIAVGPEGRRVWAVWVRNYLEGADTPEKNNLYILRLVIENEEELETAGADRATTIEAFKSVIRAAQNFAAEWSCSRVDLWNPTGVVAQLLRDSGLEHEIVEREQASIPSLMWYGEGVRTEDVVWVNNEKYCWC